jgi:hypothetical protein
MDFHSHLASTEIIGLLGGTFNAKDKILTIELAFPCNSTSTEVQVKANEREREREAVYEVRDHILLLCHKRDKTQHATPPHHNSLLV